MSDTTDSLTNKPGTSILCIIFPRILEENGYLFHSILLHVLRTFSFFLDLNINPYFKVHNFKDLDSKIKPSGNLSLVDT